MSHTTGPWYTEATSTIGHYAVTDADGFTVCNPSPMGQANARLIAAAPELLDALYAALPYVEEGEEFNHPDKRDLSKTIRALISKVEGQQ